MRIVDTPLPELIVIEPDLYRDHRGVFWEMFREKRYQQAGIRGPFVQDNFSWSGRHTLRGLHYQLRWPQGKLVTVVHGSVYDVAVDIRRGSPTFGRWYGIELSDRNMRQLYIPPGFAHGFCVLSETAGFFYKCTDVYQPADERGIAWNDPELQIPWPTAVPVISSKDQSFKSLAAMRDELPNYDGLMQS
jgi:dTDP-4-dehydrorhamnose 3,5-epimerase